MTIGGVTVPDIGEWIRTGALAALLAVVLNFYLRLKAGDRAGYGSLIEALEKRVAAQENRITKLEESEQECQRRLSTALGRIAQLEGYNQGSGRAAQEAAGVVAIERLAEQQAAKRKRKGGAE